MDASDTAWTSLVDSQSIRVARNELHMQDWGNGWNCTHAIQVKRLDPLFALPTKPRGRFRELCTVQLNENTFNEISAYFKFCFSSLHQLSLKFMFFSNYASSLRVRTGTRDLDVHSWPCIQLAWLGSETFPSPPLSTRLAPASCSAGLHSLVVLLPSMQNLVLCIRLKGLMTDASELYFS